MLRVQFLLLIVAAVVNGRIVIAQDRPDEATAVEKIELLGGKVIRNDKLPRRPVIEVSMRASQKLNDDDLRLLHGFESLTSLNLYGTKVTDAGMKELGRLTSLLELGLSETKITDASLKELRELKNLTERLHASTRNRSGNPSQTKALATWTIVLGKIGTLDVRLPKLV
jgi:internalin A